MNHDSSISTVINYELEGQDSIPNRDMEFHIDFSAW
jgi:hypothetical protein